MQSPSAIIPLRFRIDETYLHDMAVSISRFAYEQACQDFLDSMQRLASLNAPRNFPYKRLNTVLTALAPTLAHPFVRASDTLSKRTERQLLVVGEDVKRRPTTEQLSDVIYEWGKQWGSLSFENEVKGAGRSAYQLLLGSLQEPLQQWQDVDAAYLFRQLGTGVQTGFTAIPSLLASLLLGKTSVIHGKQIIWRLTQDGERGLAAISQPFLAEYEEWNPYIKKMVPKRGTFAYKLEFRLQTQVGSAQPWVHLYVRCSRYVDGPLSKKNWQRDISVKMGVDQARLSGWEYSPTLVTLPVTGSKNNPHWDNHLASLLEAMKARSLIEPAELFLAPPKYRESTSRSLYDKYFVLHAEGFKPNHQVKTGFDFPEIHEVARSVGDLLGLKLSLGQKLAVDRSASALRLDKLSLSMYTLNEFHRKTFVGKQYPQQTEEEQKQQSDQVRQEIVVRALRRSAQQQPVTIYLCWSDSFTKEQLQQALRRALFLAKDDSWPVGITLIIPPSPIPEYLLQPLDSGALDPSYRFQSGLGRERQRLDKAWEEQMRRSFAEKTQEWEHYLSSIREGQTGYGLALIELQPLNESKYYKDQSIKGAVRNACDRLGWASQMIFPLSPLPKSMKKVMADESLGRMRNAVADLLYRQTGLIYEQPWSLYTKAGLSQELAEQLHVIGLYKIRKYSPKVQYSLAICLFPDGTYRALLPQYPQRWLPLLEACQIIGEAFRKKEQRHINLSDADLTRFAAHVFTSMSNIPALVLLEAQDWRNHNLFPQFANGKEAIQNQNRLDLTHVESFAHQYDHSDLPGLRLIRLRPIGSLGETPQYVPVFEEEDGQLADEKDFKQLTGLVDTQVESPFFHYLSIGRMPQTANRQKANQPLYKLDENGGIAFKHQTLVEFVPFFLQPGDEAQAWCRIAHFLRVSPGWDGGNIILPYPLHLAKDILEDQLCILEGGLEKKEDG